MSTLIEGTVIRCVICGAYGGLERKRNPHPECPDLVHINPPGWWLGYVGDVDAGGRDVIQTIGVCSEACADRLLSQSLGGTARQP